VNVFHPSALEHLKYHYWHGNLRELQNVIKRAVLLSTGEEVGMESLPHEIIAAGPPLNGEDGDSVNAFHHPRSVLKSVSGQAERQAIIDVLEKTGFNKTRAAELLKIDRKTLYNKLKAYDIKL
jgi:two-component system response regulator HydG